LKKADQKNTHFGIRYKFWFFSFPRYLTGPLCGPFFVFEKHFEIC
jgi:hypothetical protein